MPKTSVCMATYNGQKFVEEQINSILLQLEKDDELIIVDDCSSDDTFSIIHAIKDERIKLFKNEKNVGHVGAFARAILQANNDVIFLSDQDDIWKQNRKMKMLNALDSNNALVVASNFDFINEKSEKVNLTFSKLLLSDSINNYKNLCGIFFGKRPYFGCAMAFSKNIKPLVLPIPSYVESHDLWLAIAGNLSCKMAHLEEPTLLHRIHDNNMTPRLSRSFLKKIKSRIIFLISMCTMYIRLSRLRHNNK